MRHLIVVLAILVAGCSSDTASGPSRSPAAHEYLYTLSSNPAALYGFSLDTHTGALTALSPASVSITGTTIAATPDGKTLYVSRANPGAAGMITRFTVSASGALTLMDSTAFTGVSMVIDTIAGQTYLFTDGIVAFNLGSDTAPGLPSAPVGPPVGAGPGWYDIAPVTVGPGHCLSGYTARSYGVGLVRAGAGGAMSLDSIVPLAFSFAFQSVSPSGRLQFILGFGGYLVAIVQPNCGWSTWSVGTPDGATFGSDAFVYAYLTQSAGWSGYRVSRDGIQNNTAFISGAGLDVYATNAYPPVVDPNGSFFIQRDTAALTAVEVFRINTDGTWTLTQPRTASPAMGDSQIRLSTFVFIGR